MGSDLSENYQKAYGHSLSPGRRPALLLIDFVRAYFDERSELYAGVDAALASALRIRAVAREHKVPVILTNVVYQADGRDGGRFFEKVKPLRHFVAGGELGGWPDGLAPLADELVISKQYPSAFFGTSLSSTLTSLGVDTLILTGLTTSGCVRATCVDTISHGFTPLVVRNACGDRHAAPHEANLFDMQAKYAEVIDEAAAIGYLRSL